MKRNILLILLLVVTAKLYCLINYQYDNLNRLTQVTYTNGTVVSYTFDELGNRISKSVKTATVSVAASAVPSSSGSVSGVGSYSVGQSCTLAASPNNGYSFVNWTEGGVEVSTTASYTFTVAGARTLVANFAQNTINYTVSSLANPTIGGSITGNGTYKGGQSCTLSATPASGYLFQNWTENGLQVSASPTYTFNVASNRTLVANFTPIPINYTVAANASPTVGGTIVGGGSYQSGQSCTLIATPNSGYTFVNWTENGAQVSTLASYSFIVSGNRALVANFTQIPVNYSITTSANPTNGGTTSGGGTVLSGTIQTVVATPNSGYTFVNWTENGTQVSTLASYTFTVGGNRALVANFAQNSVSFTISTSANPTNGGTTSGGGTMLSGTTQTVVATPNSGYTFVNWTENGTQVSTSASYSFTVGGNRTLVANFTQNSVSYIISTSANPTNGGTTSGGGTVLSGTTQTVIATPNSGYTFVNWTENGAQVSTLASYTFTVGGNRSLVANFSVDGVVNAQNLLVNPSFEFWTAGNPDGWTVGAATTGTFTQSPVVVDGLSSIQIAAIGTFRLTQIVTAPDGTFDVTKKYKIVLNYKTLAGDGTDERVWCNWITSPVGSATTAYWSMSLADSIGLKGPGGNNQPGTGINGDGANGYLFSNPTSSDWKSYSYIFTPPLGATQFLFDIRTYRTATAIWDNLYFGLDGSASGIEGTRVNQSQLRLYPNPAKSSIKIKSTDELERIEICDISGRVIRNEVVNSETITFNISSLQKGIYIVKGYSNGKVFVQRLIKE